MYSLKLTLYTYNPNNFTLVENFLQKQSSIKFINNLKFNRILLKATTKNFTVLKSPHVNKTSREHFQYKIHKKLYTIKHNKILPLLFINYFLFKKLTINFLIKSKIKYKCL